MGEKPHPVLFTLMDNLHSSFPICFWLRESMEFEVLFQMRPLYDTRDYTQGQTTRCGCGNHKMPTKMRSLWSQGFFWIRSVWPEPSLSVRSKENGKDKPQSTLSVPLAETCDVFSFTLQVWNQECQEKNRYSSINSFKIIPYSQNRSTENLNSLTFS